MNPIRAVVYVLVMSLSIACAGGVESDEGPGVTSRVQGVTSPEGHAPAPPVDCPVRPEPLCLAHTPEACLSQPGCAWADRGEGLECFYIGPVYPLESTGSGNPDCPDSPKPLCQGQTVDACLAEDGCAWGDFGKGPACFYIGDVVPQDS